MAELNRRSLLRTAGRIGTAAGLTALAGRGAWLAAEPFAGREAAVLDRELRIGYLPITDASALLVAHEQGLLQAAGLPSATPVLFRSWDALAQALSVGAVDAVHLLMPLALQLRLGKKVPLKVVSWGHTNGSTLTVANTITNTEQLSGTRLAMPAWWSIHSVLSQRLLREAGLRPVIGEPARPGTVELVLMAPAEMVAALASGSISGFAVADPFSAVAENQKIGHVHRFLGDLWADHACCAITVRQDLVDQHPQAVQALTDAVVAAQSWLGDHRGEAGALLTGAGFLPQPEPAVTKVFTRTQQPYAEVIKHADWAPERLGFSAWPHASYTTALVEQLRTTTIDGDTSFLPAQAADAHTDLVDDRFVTTSLQRVGATIAARQELIAP
ncbi:ABC transporter substrate-binding protein [Propionibacteriaceae bacterium Y1923]|uniref:ABC transporter substrate-binding protein n=1 Tax=Aestuariimicrobium sp. Y1814 TaxID=3418742 RepID=UPI003C204282